MVLFPSQKACYYRSLRQGSPEHIYCLVPTGDRWEPVLKAQPRGNISLTARAPRLVTVGRASHMRSQAEPGNEGKTGYYRSRSGATLVLSEPSLWLPTGARDKADPVGGISFTRMDLCLVTR
ncbi:MAG: hypothetical protein AB4352_24895, partial [Hormoscilla sp.]